MINEHDIEDMRPDNAHTADLLVERNRKIEEGLSDAIVSLDRIAYQKGLVPCNARLVARETLTRINEILKG